VGAERKLACPVEIFRFPLAYCLLPFLDSAARQRGDLMQRRGMLDSLYVRRVAIAMIIAKAPSIHRPISLFRLLKASTFLGD